MAANRSYEDRVLYRVSDFKNLNYNNPCPLGSLPHNTTYEVLVCTIKTGVSVLHIPEKKIDALRPFVQGLPEGVIIYFKPVREQSPAASLSASFARARIGRNKNRRLEEF